MSLPRLIVFDLDFTLWDCGGTWCDCLTPPFRMEQNRVLDRHNSHIQIYPFARTVFKWAAERDIPLALASRTEQPRWAIELLRLLELSRLFRWQQIFPDCKLRHFEALQRDSGIEFQHMLFFDDEQRNIRDVTTLGVTCVHVPNGFDERIFIQGLDLHSRETRQTENCS